MPAASSGIGLSLTQRSIGGGALAGLLGGLVFATAHAIVIVPIWSRMAGGLAMAAGAGMAAGWAFAALHFAPRAERSGVRAHAAAGLRFGAALWLAVVPVTLADAALRLTGIARRPEWIAVAVALLLASAGGVLLGARRGRGWRPMLAGAVATVALTMAMAGPVPIPNGRRAVGIFLATLPVCLAAGLVLGAAVSALGRIARS